MLHRLLSFIDHNHCPCSAHLSLLRTSWSPAPTPTAFYLSHVPYISDSTLTSTTSGALNAYSFPFTAHLVLSQSLVELLFVDMPSTPSPSLCLKPQETLSIQLPSPFLHVLTCIRIESSVLWAHSSLRRSLFVTNHKQHLTPHTLALYEHIFFRLLNLQIRFFAVSPKFTYGNSYS